MTKQNHSLLIAAAGLATSIATAFGITLINTWTGFNLFTISFFVILPLGAILCGFAASSGYYFAAKHFHNKPSKILLAQMALVAAMTQILIYWLEYQSLVIDGIKAASFVSFSEYLDVMLTSTHLRMGRGAHIDTGEVGTFGYWLAFFQFLGFLIGGITVYIKLASDPTCSACDQYLRQTLSKTDTFEGPDQFSAYYDGVYAHPVDSHEFSNHVGQKHKAEGIERGALKVATTVFECPSCFGQSVKEEVQVFNGQDWKDVTDLNRFLAMPAGIDVRPSFRTA